jgi:hypothetical protein
MLGLTHYRIAYQLANEDATLHNITINVLNIGIDQQIPAPSPSTISLSSAVTSPTTTTVPRPSSTSSSLSRVSLPTSSTLAPVPSSSSSAAAILHVVQHARLLSRSSLRINQTVSIQRANLRFNWDLVGLPAGRYRFIGTIDDSARTTAMSNIFSVVESGSNACLASWASLSSVKASRTVSTSPTGANAGTATKGSGISGGAIAGIVIGALVIMTAIGALVWFFRRRRQQQGRAPYISSPRMTSLPRNTSSGRMAAMSAFGIHTDRYLSHQQIPNTSGASDDAHTFPSATSAALGTRADEHAEENEKNGSRSVGSPSDTFLGQSYGRNPFASGPTTPAVDAPTEFIAMTPTHSPRSGQAQAGAGTGNSDFGPSTAATLGSASASGSSKKRMPLASPMRKTSGSSTGTPGVQRNTSMSKRKPVPQLQGVGPAKGKGRTERKGSGASAGGDSSGSENREMLVSPRMEQRKSYTLAVDPPLRQE